MKSISFDIYEPSRKPDQFTRNNIVYSLFTLSILLLLIPYDFMNRSGELLMCGAIVLSVYFTISIYSSYEPLRGKISGEITFKSKEIIVNDYKFELSKIKSIDFWFVDYYGKRGDYSRGNFNQLLSQGVANHVQVIDTEGKVHIVNFKLNSNAEHKNLEEILDEYCKQDKISFARKYELQRTEFYL